MSDIEPATLEAEIVADADNLDALGAVSIARVFSYGGEIGSPIYDPARPVSADDTGAGATQFHKKILEWPEQMYTDAGRDLTADRAAFVRDYLERLEGEVTGKQ